jgi:serine/threonine-protein kinase
MTLPEPFSEKYEILETLGQGGMGAVYRVRHRLLDEPRVVKVVRSPLEPTPQMAERFRGQAWRASRLRHRNLALLHDYAITGDGHAVLVMEDVEGLPLRELLDRFGTPPLAVALEIGRQVCGALGALHEQQILGADLAPENLLLSRDVDGWPLVRLIDLGITRIWHGEAGDLATGGVFLGKLRYAAPEELEGGQSDARTDLYSFGVVLYELLTGRLPFEGHDPRSWMAAHLFGTPLDFAVSDLGGLLPEDLRALVLRTLARNPEERIASAAELGQALEVIQARHPLVGDELTDPLAAPAEPPLLVVPEPEEVVEPVELVAPMATETPSSDWEAVPLFRAGEEGMEEMPPPDRRPRLSAAVPIAVLLALGVVLGLMSWPWRPPQAPTPKPQPQPVQAQAVPAAPSPVPVETPVAAPVVEESPLAEFEQPAEEPAGEPAVIEPEKRPHPRPLSRLPSTRPPGEGRPKAEKIKPKAEKTVVAKVVSPLPGTGRAGEGRGAGGEGALRTAPAKSPVSTASFQPMHRGDLIQNGPGVSVPVPLDMPRFSYPPAARGVAGDVDVHLDLLVDENGRVIDAKVREGDPHGLGFNEIALAAARKVRFQPATRGKIPGKMWTEMILEFSAGR